MSEFIVSARKYRPSTFASVVGQKSTTTTLKNAIRKGHLAQAYLFCGPRGVGKTTCARIFAKTINCQNISPDNEPCNTCESCISFNQNRSYNIHELDAASNNSVDDIRSLIEKVRIPPQVSKYSVYIIDEVHMLSQSAFNAFLKTLEEPPKHALFILATTEKHKIIPTILSRCQIYDFNRIQIKDSVEFLASIAKNEGIEFESDALNIIAQKADGAMRDALSIFDQVVSFSEEKFISYQKVIENLNVLDYEYYFMLTDAFLTNNVAKSLLVFDEILNKGFDAHNFINGLSRHFRDILVCKSQNTLQLLEVGQNIQEKYLNQAALCDDSFVYRALEICSETDISFRSSKNQRLHVELALVKICNLSSEKKNKLTSEILFLTGYELDNPAQTNNAVNTVQDVQINYKSNSKQPAAQKITSLKETLKKIDSLGTREKEINISDKEPKTESTDDFTNTETTNDQLQIQYNLFVERLKGEHPRLYSALKLITPQLLNNKDVLISFQNNTLLDEFRLKIKPSLFSYLRSNFNNSIEIIDEIATIENIEKPLLYSDNEKLQHMIQKNPALLILKSKFNLDFE